MNSSKRLASSLVFATATALSFTAYAQTGTSTLDRAASILKFGEDHEWDRDSHHRRSPVVGMWITTLYDGRVEDDKKLDLHIQQFFSDGLELMSSRFDPRFGNSCFGVWKDLGHNTFKLRHTGWSFALDTGLPDGGGHLIFSFTVSEDGKTYKGTYTAVFINLEGNVVPEWSGEGDVLATRYEVDGKDEFPQVMGKALSPKWLSSGGPKRKSC